MRDKGLLKKCTAYAVAVFLVCALFAYSWKGAAGSPSESITAMKIDLSGKDYETKEGHILVQVSGDSVNTVRPEIFGGNVSWIDDGYGLWDPASGAPDQTMLAKLKESGITHLRYPGGIEGDYFHWEETVGDMTERKDQIYCFSAEYPTYDDHNGVKYPVTFGVEELFRTCRDAGIEATIQLNTGNGTPEEAAAYVKFLRRNGYIGDVESICVGNEACMAAEKVQGIRVTKTPEEYIEFCRQFFSSVGTGVTNSEDITLGVIGITPSHPLCVYDNWDKDVIEALSSKIDFIDVHIGYSYYSQKDESPEDCVRCFLASSKWIDSMIREEEQIIAEHAGSRADDVSIQISECGPVGGYYPNSVAGAIFTADLYNTVLRHSKVTATDYLPALNHYASAQLIGACTYRDVSPRDVYWDNCVSYVFRWLSQQSGRKVLDVSVGGAETFDSIAIGLVPGITGVPEGDAQVYYDEESGTGSVFVINKSLGSNLTFDIELPTDYARITAVNELWNADPTASNSFAKTNRVQPASYADCCGECDGNIGLTAKPVSLVKIDFDTTPPEDPSSEEESSPEEQSSSEEQSSEESSSEEQSSEETPSGEDSGTAGGAEQLFTETDTPRSYGDNRYETAISTAQALKKVLGKDKFDTVIIASGSGSGAKGKFPDALAGSYLASVREAPILLVGADGTGGGRAAQYIRENVTAGGRVYILGGTGAVPGFVEDLLSGFTVIRLAGETRYDTDLEILSEAGLEGEDLLVADGRGFADALSASALGRPILLTDKKAGALSEGQRSFLTAHEFSNVFILGGESAVPGSIETELAELLPGAVVERLAGADRYETSVAIAERFFADAPYITLATGVNFPDGLTGGVLSGRIGAPLILTCDRHPEAARDYIARNPATGALIFGGESALGTELIGALLGR